MYTSNTEASAAKEQNKASAESTLFIHISIHTYTQAKTDSSFVEVYEHSKNDVRISRNVGVSIFLPATIH